MTTILLTLLQKVHSHEKRHHDLQGEILPDFPTNLNCHLTLRRILAQEMFGLAPAGLGGGDGSRGESFGFLFPRGICFPPRGKVVAKATHTVEAETRNFLFWTERRDLWTCGGRGRGLVQDICYELASDQSADY